MNRYLKFLENYTAVDNTYTWFKEVRYGIQKSDNENYYVLGNNKKLYPIPKELEFTVYTIEDFAQDKKN